MEKNRFVMAFPQERQVMPSDIQKPVENVLRHSILIWANGYKLYYRWPGATK